MQTENVDKMDAAQLLKLVSDMKDVPEGLKQKLNFVAILEQSLAAEAAYLKSLGLLIEAGKGTPDLVQKSEECTKRVIDLSDKRLMLAYEIMKILWDKMISMDEKGKKDEDLKSNAHIPCDHVTCGEGNPRVPCNH